MMQVDGEQIQAKADTVFLALEGAVTEDRSRFGEDVEAAGLGGWESPSPRGALPGERTIELRIVAEPQKSITLAQHGTLDGLARTWWVGTDEFGQLAVGQGQEVLLAVATPTTEPPWDLTLVWSTRINPDAEALEDLLRSELSIYDHGTEAWMSRQVFEHGAPSTSPEWTLSLGGRWDGAELLEAAATPLQRVRISTRFHSSVEIAEDSVGPRPEASLALAGKSGVPPSVWRGDGALGDVAQAPAQLNASYFAAAAAEANLRGWSPLVNEVLAERPTWGPVFTPARCFTLAPGAAAHNMGIQWLRWVTLPDGATHACVRIHVTSWVLQGEAVPISWRCYSLNRPPILDVFDPEEPALETDFAQGELEVDHGEEGLGQWLTLGVLELQRYAGAAELLNDTTHLVLAYAVDPKGESGDPSMARWRLNAWTVEPLYLPAPADVQLGVSP